MITGNDEIHHHGRGTSQHLIVRSVGDDHGAIQWFGNYDHTQAGNLTHQVLPLSVRQMGRGVPQ